VIEPVSLIFCKVPVSSSANAGAESIDASRAAHETRHDFTRHGFVMDSSSVLFE
jgi:hypothetical protein